MEGLKVPKKQPKRRRLWLNDGSCIRLRPEYKDHVWSYDFMVDRTTDGRATAGVITTLSLSSSAKLEGFTIRKGKANYGGGMRDGISVAGITKVTCPPNVSPL